MWAASPEVPLHYCSVLTVDEAFIRGSTIGSKYIAQGILFKFALDKHDMYGGDANAMKAAGHELKVPPFPSSSCPVV